MSQTRSNVHLINGEKETHGNRLGLPCLIEVLSDTSCVLNKVPFELSVDPELKSTICSL